MTTAAGVEIIKRWHGDNALWFVLNHMTEVQTVSAPEGLIKLLDGNANVEGVLDLPPYGVCILATSWPL